MWLAFGLLFGFGVLCVWEFLPAAPKPPRIVDAQDLYLNLSSLDPVQPAIFSFPMDSRHRVDFFVQPGPGKGITVAFASCRRCYRSGHYMRGSKLLCGHCNETMELVRPGQTPGTDKDCKHIPIPFEQSSDRVIVRADAVRAVFAQWYEPVISEVNFGSGSDEVKR